MNRMTDMIPSLSTALTLTLAILAGCAPRASQVATTASQPTTAGAVDHQHHNSPLPATAGPGFTVADVRFMQHMIGHHAQAIQMAALVASQGASDKVQQLAQKIDISQRDEIAMMKQWLTERKQAVPTDTQSHAMMMPGMLTAAQFAQLEAARGREFDRLFLGFMIRHHEGALLMVEELFKQPGAGQDSDIFRFATDVDADQRDEIFVMQKLLDTLQ
jgi:uncharacterized protein (DUF305 family)